MFPTYMRNKFDNSLFLFFNPKEGIVVEHDKNYINELPVDCFLPEEVGYYSNSWIPKYFTDE